MGWFKRLFSRDVEGADEGAPAAEAVAETGGARDDGWDAYLRQGAGGPESVALDLSLAETAARQDRATLVRLRYALRSPGADGLTDGTEGDALARIEDALGAALAPTGAVYAGRVTGGGAREHLFYLADPAQLPPALEPARASLEGYAFTVATEEDATWRAYREELFPTPRVRQWLADRRTVEALARQGDRPAAPRPVEHRVSFETTAAADAFVTEAAAAGFELAGRRDDAAPPRCVEVRLRRTDPVTLRHIHEVVWTLCALAERHGGDHEGWSAPVERTAPPVATARA